MPIEEPNHHGRTEADAALEAGKEIGKLLTSPQIHTIGANGKPFMLLPPDELETVDLSAFLDKPLHVKQRPSFTSLDSFAAYVNRFKDERTVIFANIEQDTVLAVMDYHRAEGASTGAENLAHQATLKLTKSEEWKAWAALNRKYQGQADLANFLEERSVDIREPASAEIVDVVRDLKLKSDVKFEKAINDVTGSTQLVYTENVSERGTLQLPTRWVIALRPYRHCDPVGIEVRLRYRLREGAVTFEYRITRPDRVLEDAFNNVIEKVEAQTKVPLFHGAP